MKILLIEDEPELRDLIADSLRKEQFLIETASDFQFAWEKIVLYDYDCILLDIMLPEGSGFTLLQEFKKLNRTDPVIIISAKDSVEDKVKGLDLGADDYLAKPFHLVELNSRVKSVIRRKQLNGADRLQKGNLCLSFEERQFFTNGKPLVLNRKEFDILEYFMTNFNRLVRKTTLAEHVWGDHADQVDSMEFIYSQIKNLRKKLKEAGADPEITAVYGVGYKLTLP